MLGLVLWFNPEARVGMIWSEDQGPLVFIGPDADLPKGIERLETGDGVTFSFEDRDGLRFVRDLVEVMPRLAETDPRALLASAQEGLVSLGKLRSVA